MDLWTKERIPYFFLIDYKCQKPVIYRLDELEEHNVKISFPHKPSINLHKEDVAIYKYPTSFERYKAQFTKAMELMEQESVCLLNLTCETPIDLNAGSIAGTPKAKALEIIDNTEIHNRNYYSGVCGIFDGESLDSCVLIRFIEQRGGSFFYKSGGGITSQSSVLSFVWAVQITRSLQY
ncbi:MAG: chorismate-binding protein [Bacteroidales bacterium]|nr:chorismate-binding protein [Bacteroidales bacterium]